VLIAIKVVNKTAASEPKIWRICWFW